MDSVKKGPFLCSYLAYEPVSGAALPVADDGSPLKEVHAARVGLVDRGLQGGGGHPGLGLHPGPVHPVELGGQAGEGYFGGC